MMLRLVFSILVGFFIGSSLSVIVGISKLYRASGCTTAPFQVEIVYGGVCIYTRSDPSSFSLNPAVYANAFPNGTIIIHAYPSGIYGAVSCTGAFSTSVQQAQINTCSSKKSIGSNDTYYETFQLIDNPGLASLTGNRPYALVK